MSIKNKLSGTWRNIVSGYAKVNGAWGKLDVLYTQKVNGFTDDFSASFCTNNLIDWEKLLDFISKNKS